MRRARKGTCEYGAKGMRRRIGRAPVCPSVGAQLPWPPGEGLWASDGQRGLGEASAWRAV
eukprot:1519300-Pyramimonas_sp.AAC.1